MEIELLPNNAYVYSTKRLGVDKDAMLTTGTFTFEKDGNTIILPEIANVPNAFLVEEGKIVQLDKNQKKITNFKKIKADLHKIFVLFVKCKPVLDAFFNLKFFKLKYDFTKRH